MQGPLPVAPPSPLNQLSRPPSNLLSLPFPTYTWLYLRPSRQNVPAEPIKTRHGYNLWVRAVAPWVSRASVDSLILIELASFIASPSPPQEKVSPCA